jgi:hypothetical protein
MATIKKKNKKVLMEQEGSLGQHKKTKLTDHEHRRKRKHES